MTAEGRRLSAGEEVRSADSGVERSSCGFRVNCVGVEH
jgi:hypothetical protein